jgi:hypothetical protein
MSLGVGRMITSGVIPRPSRRSHAAVFQWAMVIFILSSVFERKELLNRSFTIGLRAEYRGFEVGMKGRRKNFCGRSSLTIDEDKEWGFYICNAIRDVLFLYFSLDSGDHFAWTEKKWSHINCCLKRSTTIISQIEEDSRVFSGMFFEDFFDIFARVIIKRKKFYMEDITYEFVSDDRYF